MDSSEQFQSSTEPHALKTKLYLHTSNYQIYPNEKLRPVHLCPDISIRQLYTYKGHICLIFL